MASAGVIGVTAAGADFAPGLAVGLAAEAPGFAAGVAAMAGLAAATAGLAAVVPGLAAGRANGLIGSLSTSSCLARKCCICRFSSIRIRL